jgi:hypothetical protein
VTRGCCAPRARQDSVRQWRLDGASAVEDPGTSQGVVLDYDGRGRLPGIDIDYLEAARGGPGEARSMSTLWMKCFRVALKRPRAAQLHC